MTQTYGLTPVRHAEIRDTLDATCRMVELILGDLGDAYPMASDEYQVAYKALITMEAFKVRMLNAQENEREQRGLE